MKKKELFKFLSFVIIMLILLLVAYYYGCYNREQGRIDYNIYLGLYSRYFNLTTDYNNLVNKYNNTILDYNKLLEKYNEVLEQYRSKKDVSAPSDRIKESDIQISRDEFKVNYDKKLFMISFNCTGSMLPTMDCGHNAIVIEARQDDLRIGDIVVYVKNNGEMVSHRIIKIGNDDLGWYTITRGDNNSINDEKIRFDKIKYVIITLLY